MSHSPIDSYDFLDDETAAAAANEGASLVVKDEESRVCEVQVHRCAGDADASSDNASGLHRRDLLLLLDFDTDDDDDDENIASCRRRSNSSSLMNYPPPPPSGSHHPAYPDANSHSNYNLLLTEDTPSSADISRSKNLEVPTTKADDTTDNYETNSPAYSVANSHILYGDNFSIDRQRLLPIEANDEDNYAMANSHSNYRVFYNRCSASASASAIDFSRRSRIKLFESSPVGDSSHGNSKSTEETSITNRDIENCLVQIEQSLLNIEKNLLRVQQLDIPELNNLLYENSPRVELNTEKQQQRLRFQGSSSGECRRTTPAELICPTNVDNFFIPNNSLEESAASAARLELLTNYKNFNNDTAKIRTETSIEHQDRRNKCSHRNRTNSLDENSDIFNRLDNYAEKNNFFSQLKDNNFLNVNAKARSEDALARQSEADEGGASDRRLRDTRIAEVEAKAREFRRAIENIVTSRKMAAMADADADDGEIGTRSGADHRRLADEKTLDSPTPADSDTPFLYDKRNKRKKIVTGVAQSAAVDENSALVPSKIISLSLSLLLAALLQAVRCLADLVEDAFRSASFERNHQLLE